MSMTPWGVPHIPHIPPPPWPVGEGGVLTVWPDAREHAISQQSHRASLAGCKRIGGVQARHCDRSVPPPRVSRLLLLTCRVGLP